MPTNVRAVFEGYPAAAQAVLGQVRGLIFEVAKARSVAPVTETVKWGEPAYLPACKAGTTVRLGWSAKRPDVCGMFVHCQTSLLDTYRARFSGELAFEGDRAVVLPLDVPVPEGALAECIALALTYHQKKVRAHG